MTPKTEAPNEARALSRAFSNVAKALGPSVVRIEVEVGAPRGGGAAARRGRPQMPDDDDDDMSAVLPSLLRLRRRRRRDARSPGPAHGVGSGFIIDTNGDIVTNRHVVQGATKVTVTMNDGKEYPAQVVGKDAQTDVAVVRLDKPPPNLVVARLGDSDKLDVGEWVVAVGSPLGLEQTVTAGIVSGKGRPGRHVQMSGKRVRGYIQTDAKINPGNSGGPLVNLEGEVVGVNTLIQVGAGGAYGFAIPVNEVRRVAQVLVKDGRVRYPYLGLHADRREGSGRRAEGQARQERCRRPGRVRRRADAGRAGGQGRACGRATSSPRSTARRSTAPATSSTTSRASDRRQGDAALPARRQARRRRRSRWASCPTRMQRQSAEAQGQGKIGLALQTLTPDVAELAGDGARHPGAVITDVVTGSPAEQAGLKPGDVIVEVDRRRSRRPRRRSRRCARPQKNGHLLRVRGAGGTRFVTVK